ncbi:DUF2868 domain-containing protein [Neisseria montereyensis]|uniref:DUF2868 domain-containing protein n=1 Tax=Neisseria montereyensis TaxID=2973938 RepID=A0ABT2FBI2_9NEIS|nr:DUF2868 domain-containing protein [Neisseria montereyensis]MCS4533562.1 DUF2868 domain-containing protein [Neisseria montereyensis]
MLNPPRQLTELVRLLQERNYIFSADPQPITEALRHAEGNIETKLNRRAEMIDSDHKLQDSLARIRSLFAWLLLAATLFWLISGFAGTVTLMQQSGLNFFFVLAGVLGLHTLMLLAWIITACLPRYKAGGFFSNPAFWIRGKDPVNQAIMRLYSDELAKPATRWALGLTVHRLWLATLIGMLAAAVLLLSVRQYTFNWESTLLSDATFVQAVHILSWLPAKLGFPVPDADAVLISRLNNDIATSRQWGGLLIGSLVCYGLLPRFAAWLVCKMLSRRTQSTLPLDKPYYRQIIQQWQRRVVDADTQSETVTAVTPKIKLDDTPKWAVMLDAEWPEKSWFKHILGQDWLDKGTADSRDTVAALKAELQQEPAQLLIGVRARSVPDRGILRQITALAEAAQGGAVVQLLVEKDFSDGLNDYLSQWHTALGERGLPWLDPARVSQQERLVKEAV